MSGLAVMLIAMGTADACRRPTHLLWIPVVVVPIAVAGAAALAGLWHLGDIGLLILLSGWGSDVAGSFASWILALGGLALAQ